MADKQIRKNIDELEQKVTIIEKDTFHIQEKMNTFLEKRGMTTASKITILISVFSLCLNAYIFYANNNLSKALANNQSYFEKMVFDVSFYDKKESIVLNVGYNEVLDVNVNPTIINFKKGYAHKISIIYYNGLDFFVLDKSVKLDKVDKKASKDNSKKYSYSLQNNGESEESYFSLVYLLIEDYNGEKEIFPIFHGIDKKSKEVFMQTAIDDTLLMFTNEKTMLSMKSLKEPTEKQKLDSGIFLKEQVPVYKKLKLELKEAGILK